MKHPKDLLRNSKVLFHWIESKVGQPWNNVYSELCSLADMRSKVGQTLRGQIGWTVEINVFIGDDDKAYSQKTGYPVRNFYVHPKTGILCSPLKVVYKPKPKKIESVFWYSINSKGSVCFESVTFDRPAKCGCVHYKPKMDIKERYSDFNAKPKICIHGNEASKETIWYVVEYGEHDPDDVYKIYSYETCENDYGFRFFYGLKKPGDKFVVYYRDNPNAQRRYEIHRKQANHKELLVLRQLINKL
jgi:hypothetical protein